MKPIFESRHAGFIPLSKRKSDAVTRIKDGVESLRKELSGYAVKHSGKFVLYGSAARGDLRFDSDVDLLIDFPKEETDKAWKFAESACIDLGLKPDVRLAPVGS